MHHQSITLGPDGSSVSPDITDTVLASLSSADAGRVHAVDAVHGPGAAGTGSAASAGSRPAVSAAELALEFFESGRADYDSRRSVVESYLQPKRVSPRSRLGARRLAYEKGLSNAAYLAATSGTRKLRLSAGPAATKLRFLDPISELDSSAPVALGAPRGAIREFSESSRARLRDFAFSLSALGHEATLMLTLTSPSNWLDVYLDQELEAGRLFKTHVAALRKRLTRFLKKLGITQWSALWFLEFQKRGAPHLHLIIFNCGQVSRQNMKLLKRWAGSAWSEIVGNPDDFELNKHRKVCSRVEKMREKHFGYACAYAKKSDQKLVPDCFGSVGRFWGKWNVSLPDSIDIEYDLNLNNPVEVAELKKMLWDACQTVYAHSPSFCDKVYRQCLGFLLGAVPRFSFTLFGTDSFTAFTGQAIDWRQSL